ncbi:MAG TPA: restriction endonuclease subunit S [Candidatus Magasanikbacteria bacterium]|nr:restriction endonuclease subunit S [Candidatus Magasanikbacteria bacterium]
MLNQDTKRKIDSARQILVGKVPDPKAQVEQITTALIYKFMDDTDKEAQVLGGKARYFTNGYEKYAWSKIMDVRLGGHDRLNLYFEAVSNLGKNKHIPQIFRDIFGDRALPPYRDAQTLTLFLKEINGFDFEHSEDLGDAYEFLLNVIGTSGEAGQFRTPRHLIDFIAAAVDPKKNETILDPACGTAGFLISAYKHILKQHDGIDDPEKTEKPLTPDEKKSLMNHFVGYDIDPGMARIATVNMYLHNFPEPKIFEYDTLTYEDRWDETFDVILANPPFMTPKGGIRPHKRFSIQANRAEVLFVDYIVDHLNINGKAGVIVPEGIIFNNQTAYKNLRKKLVEDYLIAVVSLPQGVFIKPGGKGNVKTGVLIFDKALAKKTKDVLFVKISNDGFDLGAQRRPIDKNDLPLALNIIKKFKSALKDGKSFDLNDEENEIAHLASKNAIAETGDYNLTGERYKENIVQVNQKWEMVELGDVCEILNGYAFKSENYTSDGVRIIRITNVQKGKIVDDNPKFYPINSKEPIEKYKLLENDLLVSLTGNVGRVGLLPKDFLPAGLNQRVACLRPKNNSIDNLFLYYFLNQNKFENDCMNSAGGIAQKNLSTVWLSKYQIPLPPIEVQKEIVEQIEVKQNAIDHAKAIIQNLERERRYFGQALRKLEGVEWVELGDQELFKIESGGTPDTKILKYWNGDINWATLVDLSQENFVTELQNTERKITEDGLKKSSAKLLPANTVLVSSRATIGRVAIAKKETATNQGFKNIIIKDDSKILPYFVAMCMTAKIDEMNQMASGGTFKEISKTNFETLKIPLPSLEIQKKLVAEAEKEQQIINANKQLIEIMEQKISDVLSEI